MAADRLLFQRPFAWMFSFVTLMVRPVGRYFEPPRLTLPAAHRRQWMPLSKKVDYDLTTDNPQIPFHAPSTKR